MSKRNKIIYWVATVWLCLGMISTGIVQFLNVKEEADMFSRLGYPMYLLKLLAICKFLGVVAVLIPKFPLLKEWAYAGFFFMMAGAAFSHVMNGDEASELFGPLLLLILTFVSWYFRPVDRKLIFSN